jgi:hypothetical protein
MPSQVVGIIEIDGAAADFDERLGIRLGILGPPVVSTQFVEADEAALRAELDVEYTRLLRRMRAKSADRP